MPVQIPGPKPLPVVGNALDILDTPLSELMLRYSREYGPVVRFSIVSDVLHLVSDPQALQYINTTNAKNYLDRWTPPGFETLLYNGKLRGLVFTQRRYWMQHRQVVGQVFRSSRFLSNFVEVASEKTDFLINNVWRNSNGSTINIHQAMRMLTLDVIGSAAFGAQFGAMEAGHHEIESALSNILSGVLSVIKSPLPLWRVMQTPGRAKVQRDLESMQQIELSLINERRRRLESDPHPENSNDLLAMLLKARDSSRKTYFKDEDLMWDVHDVIFAGHETTASALAAVIFLVAGSPRVMRCIQEEIRTVLPDGRTPKMEDLSKLRYLDMVLNESLRLYPPTALVGRVAKEKDVIAGYNVPAGANMLMSPYVMGRLESLWDSPLEFRPERFLPEQVRKRHPMTHTPFGAGPRVCLGARMATMEAKMVLAMLFSKFTFERTTDRLEVDYDSTVSFKSGMDMKLKKL